MCPSCREVLLELAHSAVPRDREWWSLPNQAGFSCSDWLTTCDTHETSRWLTAQKPLCAKPTAISGANDILSMCPRALADFVAYLALIRQALGNGAAGLI